MNFDPMRVLEMMQHYVDDIQPIVSGVLANGGREDPQVTMPRVYFAGMAAALELTGFPAEAQLCRTISNSPAPNDELKKAVDVAKASAIRQGASQ